MRRHAPDGNRPDDDTNPKASCLARVSALSDREDGFIKDGTTELIVNKTTPMPHTVSNATPHFDLRDIKTPYLAGGQGQQPRPLNVHIALTSRLAGKK